MPAPRIRSLAFVGDHLDQAFGRALGLGAIVLMEWPAGKANAVAVNLARRILGQPDIGQLRLGIGDPRHSGVVDLGRQAKQRVANDDPGVIAGHVGGIR